MLIPKGTCKGRSYVVFGGPGVGQSGVLLLSSLNGASGFKLDGENNGDWSGWSVSAAGDINGDEIADLMIGAYGYPSPNYKGRSYVVFGGSNVSKNGTIALSSLNGTNGFKLDGENNGDDSGFSVSAAGDINGDGYIDLFVGADGHSNSKGRSYVLFGGYNVGENGLITLSSLNGTSGFKLDGENTNDESGYSISAAGDINGDGVADLVIGARGYPSFNFRGRSYVVFGSPSLGNNGLVALSNLNGVNGFKVDGENNGDQSGASVSVAGDINGDGVTDLLIGAYGYPKGNYTGRSYVVFGDAPPVLINNSLSIWPCSKVIIQPSNLAAYDRNHPNDTLVFIPSRITHGYFSTFNASNISISNFTQSQIINGVVQFVPDGTNSLPSYDITVRSAGIAWTGPNAANITFGLALENNQLVINQGQNIR